ncbi:MAG: hypothetical protein ACEQR5_02025 [Moraxellaceae bacterium]
MNLSKSQIGKIGKQIRRDLREGKDVSEEDLSKLQEYRVSHLQSLQKVFNALAEISKHHYKGSVTVYRLKRIDTIVRKIERYPTMDLSTMQDIAGCRTIVGSESQIRKIVSEIEKRKDFLILDRNDYITNPRDTGYQSYHLKIKPVDCDRIVEVQLRTRANHHWATLVEITDLLYGIKLKEGQDHPELYLFHKLLSIELNCLTLDEKESIVRIERELAIISKLISVFRNNYFIAVDRWGRSIPNDDYQYVIMEIDENFSPSFEFFRDFEAAENMYFQKFALNEPNMVLIHVNNADFEKIGLAYSNYVLTSHPAIRFYIEILQSTILEYFVKGKFMKATNLYEYYDELIDEILASFEIEITSLRKKIDKDEIKLEKVNNHSKYHEIMEEWIDNFSERFNSLKKTHSTFLLGYEKERNKFEGAEFHKTNNKEESIIKRFINLLTRN